MKPINEHELQISLGSRSKSRLKSFRKSLTSDREKVIFDDKVIDELRKYVNDEELMEATLAYLDSVRDPDGNAFCQSHYDYQKLLMQAAAFAKANHPSFRWNRNYQKALEVVTIEVSQWRLKPISYHSDQDIRDVLPKVDTHSGYSWLLTGKKKKGEYMEGIFAKQLEFEQAARVAGSFNRPYLPGSRTQGSGAITETNGTLTDTCKLKTRLVWMEDIHHVISECRYAVPIQRAMGKVSWYAGGKDPGQIRTIVSLNRLHNNYWVTLDYSQFDASMSDWLITDAFSVLKSAFQDVDEELWRIIVNDFIHKNLILGDGVIHVDKGVPSGSMFTQIIDSLVNRIMIETFLISCGLSGSMIIMGDDNCLFTNEKVEPEVVASYISKNFGVQVNASKTQVGRRSDYPEFLSRVWRPDGEWRHPLVLLSKLAFPERFRHYSQSVTPAEVLYGYILTYRPGMNQLMNVARFEEDHPSFNEKTLAKVDNRLLPGALGYIRQYTMMDAA